MDDRLEHIFALQMAFNEDLIRRRGLDGIPMERWLQMQTLAMMSELAELIDEVNFKWWKNPKPIDQDAVRGELVDLLHFFISMCLSAGMSAEELYQRYLKKNQENFNRQNGLSAKPGYSTDCK
jgi:dimeric dUTPase (all-alpha-NTP-PPase superfamily)